ncbi:hypothetical protein BZA05DRAFT_449257 [Tricharina praecox]|uniref:uncharacterized protein n=1 Tax=Tricharina praecox TaxID=43433 RepID=UPI00221F27CE|nr:uncharacterized protein BZA05DRAFT_449257 [Tricharina praecox]KAI5842260.1 hypothetical protein BZA05DRAFT_449257 [Tricharina praecox]
MYATRINLLRLAALFFAATATLAMPVEPHSDELLPAVIYQLSAGFDATHPAFNIAAQIALFERNASAIPAPSSVPGGDALKWERHCETSEGSSHISDVAYAGAKLKYLKAKPCCQVNDQCTHLVESFTASVSVCGQKLTNFSVRCDHVGQQIQKLAKHCHHNNKAGGIARVKGFLDFNVFHSGNT